jgi:hypothetical protein
VLGRSVSFNVGGVMLDGRWLKDILVTARKDRQDRTQGAGSSAVGSG